MYRSSLSPSLSAPSELRDRNPETAVGDHELRPGSRHQLALFDDLACCFHERDKHIQRSATDVDDFSASRKQPFGGDKPEGSKRDDVAGSHNALTRALEVGSPPVREFAFVHPRHRVRNADGERVFN